MRRIILAIYAIIVSAAIIALLYVARPYVVEYPKEAIIILEFVMLSSIGARIRTMLEAVFLLPVVKIVNGDIKLYAICSFIFFMAILAAVALPWLNGVSGFDAWCWISSIVFTMFNFETLYAFAGATMRMYKFDDQLTDKMFER